MPLLFTHFWIMFIVITTANGIVWKSRSKKYIAQNPSLKEGYDSLIKGWFIFGNIPWLIMGIGMFSGMTKDMFEFLNPSAMIPIVTIFFVVLISEWILLVFWIFFKEGAEKLVKHPGLNNRTFGNEKYEIRKLKFISVASLIGWAISIVMMWNMH
jgi:hypothetical protein